MPDFVLYATKFDETTRSFSTSSLKSKNVYMQSDWEMLAIE